MTPKPPCPICQKPMSGAYEPFCSKRCADVDLNRWLSDQYVVSGSDDESTDIPEAPAQPVTTH